MKTLIVDAIGSLTLWLLLTACGYSQTVTDTHIVGTGHAPVPRMSKHRQNVLTIKAGETVTLPEKVDTDVIEIFGTAKVSRTHDTNIRLVDLCIMPGGTLDIGTAADPVERKVHITFKDVPLLTGSDGQLGPDPEQFGNGILVFGQLITFGRKLDKTWTQFSPADKGTTQLTLVDAVNWHVGDELIIPDMEIQGRELGAGGAPSGQHGPTPLRRESPVTIAAISGNTITLSKPLDFEHHTQAGELPYVANATRNIVFRSENPAGTRAHAMFMDRAHVNLFYTSFLDLGRTLPKRINNFDSHTAHVGTNQIARYGVHWHHVHGHSDDGGYTGRFVGNFLDGSGIAKWGMVQHGTHDLLVDGNVSDRFVGSCFTLAEDGHETRGHYLNNFAHWSHGNGLNGKDNQVQGGENAPGAEGSGFWLHGSEHELIGNVALACGRGYSVVHMNQVSPRKTPSVPGGPNDRDFVPEQSKPLKTEGNKSIACAIGLEIWRTPNGWTWNGFTCINATAMGVFCGSGEGAYLVLKNSRFVNDLAGAANPNEIDNSGIHSSSAYTTLLNLENVTFEGFNVGLFDARHGLIMSGGKLKNRSLNINYAQFEHAFAPLVCDGVTFERMLPTTVHIMLGQGGLLPNRFGETWTAGAPMHLSRNHNNSGKSYWLFENYGQRHVPATKSDPAQNWVTCPEDGLTVGQCWDKHHVAPNGYPAPVGSVPLDGLLNAVAFDATNEKPPVPVDPPKPPTPPVAGPPVISEITVTPPPPVLVSSTVTYSATISDPDTPLASVAHQWFVIHAGNKIPQTSGNGPVKPLVFTHGPDPTDYTVQLDAFDGTTGVSKTFAVKVVAQPVDPKPVDPKPPIPPVPSTEIELLKAEIAKLTARVAELTVESAASKAALAAAQAELAALKVKIANALKALQ